MDVGHIGTQWTESPPQRAPERKEEHTDSAQPQDTGISEADFRAMSLEQRAATIQQLQGQ